MSQPVSSLPKDDFRAAAVAASLAIADQVGQARGPMADPLNWKFSLCLPAPPGGDGVRRRARRAVQASLVAGVALLLGGGVLIMVKGGLNKNSISIPVETLVLAASMTVSGIVVMVIGLSWKWRAIRSFILARLGESAPLGAAPPITVAVENARTFHKLKLLSEDHAVLLAHPEKKILQVEGLTCRYIIRAEDVLHIGEVQTPNSRGVVVEYSLGGTLSLAIAFQRLSGGVSLRQIFNIGTDPLDAFIVKAIGTERLQ